MHDFSIQNPLANCTERFAALTERALAPRLVPNLMAAASLTLGLLTLGLLLPACVTGPALSVVMEHLLDSKALSLTVSQPHRSTKQVPTEPVQFIHSYPDASTSFCPFKVMVAVKAELLALGLPERSIAGASR